MLNESHERDRYQPVINRKFFINFVFSDQQFKSHYIRSCRNPIENFHNSSHKQPPSGRQTLINYKVFIFTPTDQHLRIERHRNWYCYGSSSFCSATRNRNILSSCCNYCLFLMIVYQVLRGGHPRSTQQNRYRNINAEIIKGIHEEKCSEARESTNNINNNVFILRCKIKTNGEVQPYRPFDLNET